MVDDPTFRQLSVISLFPNNSMFHSIFAIANIGQNIAIPSSFAFTTFPVAILFTFGHYRPTTLLAKCRYFVFQPSAMWTIGIFSFIPHIFDFCFLKMRSTAVRAKLIVAPSNLKHSIASLAFNLSHKRIITAYS